MHNFLVFLICILPIQTFAADTAIQILGIGNSFTQNATKYLPEIIQASTEVDADISLAVIGGCSLERHVKLAQAHEADSEDGNKYTFVKNRATVKKNASLSEILQATDWDYITIQQVSQLSYKSETYFPYAGQLIRYIQKYAPEAEIVIHETWPHSVDSHRAKSWGLDPDDMYAKLHVAYAQIGQDFGLRIIPVGTAFQKAKESPLWDYQPRSTDTTQLNYPEDKDNLPDESQSLHRIHFWKKEKDGTMKVINDGFHAGKYGEYLGALIWYEFFFNLDAREVSLQPKGFSEAQAVSLREIAHDTMREANE